MDILTLKLEYLEKKTDHDIKSSEKQIADLADRLRTDLERLDKTVEDRLFERRSTIAQERIDQAKERAFNRKSQIATIFLTGLAVAFAIYFGMRK